jgi:hypothetical protein
MAYVLQAACELLEAIRQVAERERAVNRHVPAAGSQAEHELDGQPIAVQQALTTARTLANLRLVVVEEHLASMARCVSDAQGVYAVYTLARTAAELSARAWWLLDPDLGPRRRASRAWVERRYSAQQVRRLPAFSRERAASNQAHLQQVEREGARGGLTAGKADRRPDGTSLMASVFEQAPELGEYAYQRLAAFTHGTAYALAAFLRLAAPAPEGALSGMTQITTTAVHDAEGLHLALIPYMKAVDRFTTYCAWPADEWRSHLAYTSSEIGNAREQAAAALEAGGQPPPALATEPEEP